MSLINIKTNKPKKSITFSDFYLKKIKGTSEKILCLFKTNFKFPYKVIIIHKACKGICT